MSTTSNKKKCALCNNRAEVGALCENCYKKTYRRKNNDRDKEKMWVSSRR